MRSLHFDRLQVDTTDIPHAFKANWVYQLPVGRGRRFGSGFNRLVDGILGGWEFSGNARFQSQRYQIVGAKLAGLYDRDDEQAAGSSVDDVWQVAMVVTVGTWLFTVVVWTTSIADPGSGKLVLFWLSAIVAVPAARALARAWCRRLPLDLP